MEFYRALPANEKLNSAQRSELDVPIALVGGDKSFAKLLPKMGEDMLAHGCKTVTIELSKTAGIM